MEKKWRWQEAWKRRREVNRESDNRKKMFCLWRF